MEIEGTMGVRKAHNQAGALSSAVRAADYETVASRSAWHKKWRVLGYIAIREGKSKNAKRNLSLTARAAEMLKARKSGAESTWAFPGDSPEAPILGTSLDHQHDDVRADLKLPANFVVHSLRHTMSTRLGEAGADGFTIMKIAGHSSVTASERYLHPAPEGTERAFERLEKLNAVKHEQATAEVKAEAAGGSRVPAKVAASKKAPAPKSSQVIEITRAGP